MAPFTEFGCFLLAIFCLCAVHSGSSNSCSQGTQCQTETDAICTVGSTTYCCPSGYITAVVKNGVLQSCNCTYPTFKGSSCSDFNSTINIDTNTNINSGSSTCSQGDLLCQNILSCTVGSTKYCCPGGRVSAVSAGDSLRSCSCTYNGGLTGSDCASGSPSFVTSASASAVMLMVLITSLLLI